MTDINFEDIRQQFPILTRQVYNKQLVYFDNAATTQKPQCVLDKTIEAYTQYNSNIHRGVHYLSQVATMAHEQARQDIADFIGSKDKKDIIIGQKPENRIGDNRICLKFWRRHKPFRRAISDVLHRIMQILHI